MESRRSDYALLAKLGDRWRCPPRPSAHAEPHHGYKDASDSGLLLATYPLSEPNFTERSMVVKFAPGAAPDASPAAAKNDTLASGGLPG